MNHIINQIPLSKGHGNLKCCWQKLMLMAITILLPAIGLKAQDTIRKEVRVEKTYEAVLGDADKMNAQPKVTDTTRITPSYDARIRPVRHSTAFQPRPIQPARLVGVPLDEFHNYYIKGGLGNYLSTQALLSYNTLRSRDYAIGALASHRGSLSKIKLDNGHRVNAGYARNQLAVNGRYMQKLHTFSGEAGITSNTHHFYGYNTDNYQDSVPSFKGKDIRQRHNYIYGDIGFVSTNTDSNAIGYHANMHIGHFKDFYENQQGNFVFNAGGNFPVLDFRLGLDIQYENYVSNTTPDSLMGSLFQFTPWFQKTDDDYSIRLGIKSVKDNVTGKFKVYPDALVEFTVVEDVLLPYMGAKGSLRANHYYQLAQENPFVKPGYHFNYRTDNKISAFAGIKGSLNRSASYNLAASFGIYDNEVLFVKDTSTTLQNQFIADTAGNTVNKITYMGEIQYDITSSLSFSGGIEIFRYQVNEDQNAAWHLPSYLLNARISYNHNDTWYANAQVMGIGKREALNPTDGSVIDLKPITDIGFDIRYRYTPLLTFYAELNNVLANQYERWHQFPAYSLNIMIGASYRF